MRATSTGAVNVDGSLEVAWQPRDKPFNLHEHVDVELGIVPRFHVGADEGFGQFLEADAIGVSAHCCA